MHIAVEKGNSEILQSLLARPELDINAKSILKQNFKYHFNNKYLNHISIQSLNSISNFDFFE